MGDYGRNTTLLVTTDHGRGDGGLWRYHGLRYPESRWGWLFAIGPNTRRAEQDAKPRYSHVSIRPTIEVIFGLKPLSCMLCGEPIAEITGNPRGSMTNRR